MQNRALTWRKSSLSGPAGHCVEIASTAAAVFVRDSKDTSGPVLEFGDAGWREFIAGVRAGEFDR